MRTTSRIGGSRSHVSTYGRGSAPSSCAPSCPRSGIGPSSALGVRRAWRAGGLWPLLRPSDGRSCSSRPRPRLTMPARESALTAQLRISLEPTIKPYVLCPADRLKMSGVATRLAAANVVNVIAGRYRADFLLIRDTVNCLVSTEHIHIAVVAHPSALPNEALTVRHGVRKNIPLHRFLTATLPVLAAITAVVLPPHDATPSKRPAHGRVRSESDALSDSPEAEGGSNSGSESEGPAREALEQRRLPRRLTGAGRAALRFRVGRGQLASLTIRAGPASG